MQMLRVIIAKRVGIRILGPENKMGGNKDGVKDTELVLTQNSNIPKVNEEWGIRE